MLVRRFRRPAPAPSHPWPVVTGVTCRAAQAAWPGTSDFNVVLVHWYHGWGGPVKTTADGGSSRSSVSSVVNGSVSTLGLGSDVVSLYPWIYCWIENCGGGITYENSDSECECSIALSFVLIRNCWKYSEECYVVKSLVLIRASHLWWNIKYDWLQ